MSSHHFVREGQEPALLIIDAIDDDNLMALLEWSPLVIVTSQALPRVESWGIRIDAVAVDPVAPSDAVVQEMLAGTATADVITDADPNAIVHYLKEKGQVALQVIIHSPEQHLEHWNVSMAFQISLLNHHMKWSRITNGRFEKWMTENAVLHYRGASNPQVSGAVSDGSVLETPTAGMVTVLAKGVFWVGEVLVGNGGRFE